MLPRVQVPAHARALLAGEALFPPLPDEQVRRKAIALPRDLVAEAGRGAPHAVDRLWQVLFPLWFRRSFGAGVLPCGGGRYDDDTLVIEEPLLHPVARPAFDARLRALIRAAEIVGAAHRAGVLHLDIKPAHIIQTPDCVWVVDWDAAMPLAELRARHGIGFCGTPAYMSPEQAAGILYLLSPATDVFALGLVLYELLHARRARRIYRDFQRQLRDARERRIVCDARIAERWPRLAHVCERAVALAPNRRYRTGALFANALRRAAAAGTG